MATPDKKAAALELKLEEASDSSTIAKAMVAKRIADTTDAVKLALCPTPESATVIDKEVESAKAAAAAEANSPWTSYVQRPSKAAWLAQTLAAKASAKMLGDIVTYDGNGAPTHDSCVDRAGRCLWFRKPVAGTGKFRLFIDVNHPDAAHF
eukprot:2541651-Pyramimonas_sp.AAC.1